MFRSSKNNLFILSMALAAMLSIPRLALSQEILFQTYEQIHIGDEDIGGWPNVYGQCVQLQLGSINKGDQIELSYMPYGLENAYIRFAGTELRLAPQVPNLGQKRPNYWGEMASVSVTSNENRSSGSIDICSENVKIGSGKIDYDDFMISSVTVYRNAKINSNLGAQTDIQKIQNYFESALGVDAESVQVSLLEAGLYLGEIDGRWSLEIKQAFEDALDWMYSRAGGVNLSSEKAFYDFVWATRDIFFDEDSGLARWPTGNSYLLSVTAHRDFNTALNNMRIIDQRLTNYGYPKRARMMTARNGWFVVAAGMYSNTGCEQKSNLFKASGIIPSDSYCAHENKFMWGD